MLWPLRFQSFICVFYLCTCLYIYVFYVCINFPHMVTVICVMFPMCVCFMWAAWEITYWLIGTWTYSHKIHKHKPIYTHTHFEDIKLYFLLNEDISRNVWGLRGQFTVKIEILWYGFIIVWVRSHELSKSYVFAFRSIALHRKYNPQKAQTS